MDAISEAAESDRLDSLKVNCVVMRNVNDNEILDFVRLTQDLNVEVRFIEYMPFDGNVWSDKKIVSYAEMLQIIQGKYPQFTKIHDTDGEHVGETSKVYQVPGFKGRIGFISSMTNHFCHTCNRIRLTADGNLKVCLFGASEVNLRDILRDTPEEQLEAKLTPVIHMAVQRKKKQHAGMYDIWKDAAANRPMIKIGG